MESKKSVFTFDDMIASLRRAMKKFPDLRTGKNTKYEVMDAASGAFSVFFTQCPSFLSHQELMQQKYGLSNAKTLFGIQNIPSDNQIRNLLDKVNPTLLSSVFTDCFSALKSSGDLATYHVALGRDKNDLLLALDGTQYFGSTEIFCDNCSTKTKGGEKHYAHTMITPTIVAPGMNKVLSLAPEFVVPQDGDKKQDCELKAAKRFLARTDILPADTGVTALGDDLYAHEPFALSVLERGWNFLFVCKPESHKTVYEWVEGIAGTYQEDRFDGKKHLLYAYKYAQGVPLRDAVKKKDTVLLVNFVEITVTDRKTKEQLYHNAFITNHPLTEQTLPLIVDCGRARWKIENENNNTLKTKGYHLEHNYGHGTIHLASLLATMNILAFLFHTMLEFMDGKYRLLRKAIGARKRFFEHIRVLLIYVPCQNFDHFMDFMTDGLQQAHDVTKLKYPV